MNPKEYERLRRQIEDQYQRDLASLDRVRELSANSEPPAPVEVTVRPDGLEEAVKAMVPGIEGVFNKRTLAARMREADPTLPVDVHNLLGSILRQMEGNELNLVERGKGKRPSHYEYNRALRLNDDDVLPANE